MCKIWLPEIQDSNLKTEWVTSHFLSPAQMQWNFSKIKCCVNRKFYGVYVVGNKKDLTERRVITHEEAHQKLVVELNCRLYTDFSVLIVLNKWHKCHFDIFHGYIQHKHCILKLVVNKAWTWKTYLNTVFLNCCSTYLNDFHFLKSSLRKSVNCQKCW